MFDGGGDRCQQYGVGRFSVVGDLCRNEEHALGARRSG